MKASKKIAVCLLIALMFGMCQPKPARAFDGEQIAQAVRWVGGILVTWWVGKAVDAAAEETFTVKKDEEKRWYHYLWPGNWF